MKRLTVRADEVRVGDRVHDYLAGKPGPVVTDTETVFGAVGVGGSFAGTVEGVEVFTDDDPLGMPAYTVPASDEVEVWR